VHGDYARCAAVFVDCDGARDTMFWAEYDRAGEKGIFGGTDQDSAERVQVASAVEEKYFAGIARDAEEHVGVGGCEGVDRVRGDGEKRDCEVRK
jgi:hypothetical protein